MDGNTNESPLTEEPEPLITAADIRTRYTTGERRFANVNLEDSPNFAGAAVCVERAFADAT